MTQNVLVFCTKCKQIFRAIDETLEFEWLSKKKDDEEAMVIEDYGMLISHWWKNTLQSWSFLTITSLKQSLRVRILNQ